MQIYQNFKWIVIDGCSDRKIRASLKRIDRIDDLIIEKDDGIYDAMNKGLERVRKNDFVLFLNSGDEFTQPDILQRVINGGFLKKGEIVYGNCYTEKGLKRARPFVRKFFFFERNALLSSSLLC